VDVRIDSCLEEISLFEFSNDRIWFLFLHYGIFFYRIQIKSLYILVVQFWIFLLLCMNVVIEICCQSWRPWRNLERYRNWSSVNKRQSYSSMYSVITIVSNHAIIFREDIVLSSLTLLWGALCILKLLKRVKYLRFLNVVFRAMLCLRLFIRKKIQACFHKASQERTE